MCDTLNLINYYLESVFTVLITVAINAAFLIDSSCLRSNLFCRSFRYCITELVRSHCTVFPALYSRRPRYKVGTYVFRSLYEWHRVILLHMHLVSRYRSNI